MDTLETVRINNSEYSKFEELSSGVFAEKYIYSNSSQNLVLVKRPSSLFQKILEKIKPDLLNIIIKNHTDVPNSSYSKLLDLIKPGENLNTDYFIFASEYGKFSLNFLIYTQKVKFDIQIIMFYFKQLASLLENLCNRKIFYYTLKLDDIFFDKNYSLKLEECIIGDMVQKGSDLSTWVNKIFLKSGTLAPELLSEDKLAHEEKTIIYNLGIILFTLVVNRPPYDRIDDPCYLLIKNKKEKEYWEIFDKTNKLNSDFKSLVYSMLSDSPWERPSFGQIFHNPWLKNLSISESYVEDYMKKLDEKFSKSMKKAIRNNDNRNRVPRDEVITKASTRTRTTSGTSVFPSLSDVALVKEVKEVVREKKVLEVKLGEIKEEKLEEILEEKKEVLVEKREVLVEKVQELEEKKVEEKKEIEKCEEKVQDLEEKKVEEKEFKYNIYPSQVFSRVSSITKVDSKVFSNDYSDEELDNLKTVLEEKASINSMISGYETGRDSDLCREESDIHFTSTVKNNDFNIVFESSIDQVLDYFLDYFFTMNFKVLFVSDSLMKKKDNNFSKIESSSDINKIILTNRSLPEYIFEVRFQESESKTVTILEFINHNFSHYEFKRIFNKFNEEIDKKEDNYNDIDSDFEENVYKHV